jgi:hypothetical protein
LIWYPDDAVDRGAVLNDRGASRASDIVGVDSDVEIDEHQVLGGHVGVGKAAVGDIVAGQNAT